MAKWHKLLDDQKICRHCQRNNIETEIHVSFDLWIFWISIGSLRSLDIFGQYIHGIFEIPENKTKGEFDLYHISLIQFLEHRN